MSSEKALAQATGSLGLSSHSFHLSAPHSIQSSFWRWATSSTGFTLPVPPSFVPVCDWTALCSPCPCTVTVLFLIRFYFEYHFLKSKWLRFLFAKLTLGNFFQVRDLRSSLDFSLLDLHIHMLAGVTQTDPSDLVFSSFQQALLWDTGAREIPCL